MSSQNSPGNSPSLLTPPSPREDHNTDENPPLGTLTPSTMTAVFQEGFATASTMTAVFQDGFATAPDFLAPADFGNTTSAATTTTRVLESFPTTLTDLDRILAAIGGINARFDNQHADINARFDGVTACFDALGGRLQAFESLGPRLDALDERVRMTDEHVKTTDGVLCNLDKCITTTTDLITDATTCLDAQMKKVDEVATDKLIDYGSRLVDYGSRLGHFTNTLIPKLRSDLDAFVTRVTNIEGRPPNPTTQDVRHSDASSTASVASAADDASDHLRPPTVDNERFSATGRSPNIEDEQLSPTTHSCMAWAEAQNTRATNGHPVGKTYVQPPSYRDNRPNPIRRPDLPVDNHDTPYDLSSVGPLESPRLDDREHRARQLGHTTLALTVFQLSPPVFSARSDTTKSPLATWSVATTISLRCTVEYSNIGTTPSRILSVHRSTGLSPSLLNYSQRWPPPRRRMSLISTIADRNQQLASSLPLCHSTPSCSRTGLKVYVSRPLASGATN